MNTQRNRARRTPWAAGAALALIFAATARAETLEEVTVIAPVAASRTQQESFEADMAAYVRSVEAAIDAARLERLQQLRLPAIKLALVHGSHRG